MTTSSLDINMIEKKETTDHENTKDATAIEIIIRAMETTGKEMEEATKMTTEGKHEIYKNDL